MYLLLMTLCFADFTWSPPAGFRIDVSRSGKMSEHRYVLIMDQIGTVNHRVYVLNEQGAFLYEVPEASNAHFVANNLLGDEDMLFFREKGGGSVFIWHHQYGMRELKKNNYNLGKSGGEYIKLSEQGKRMYLASRYHKSSLGSEPEPVTSIEEVKFQASDAASLFADPEISFEYQLTSYQKILNVIPTKTGFLLHEPDRTGNVYQEYIMGNDGGSSIGDPDRSGQAHDTRRELTTNSLEFHVDAGYISLFSDENAEYCNILVDEDSGLEVLRSCDPSTSVGRELGRFFNAFAQGRVEKAGQVLSYITDEALCLVNLGTGTLARYPHQYGPVRMAKPSSTELVKLFPTGLEVDSVNLATLRFQSPEVMTLP